MTITFTKYQGTGNDFIMIDQRNSSPINHSDKVTIKKMCDRKFGIGADGLILLENSDHYDFKMVYFNADGGQSSMCGNGGRCIVHFAWKLGLFDRETTFEAIDGLHQAHVWDDETVSLQMADVQSISQDKSGCFVLNTGSPHYVKWVESWPQNIQNAGAEIRYSPAFAQDGINVNFVERHHDYLAVATYERGVEDETLSCGTGVTAAAMVSFLDKIDGKNSVEILTKGGKLSVSCIKNGTQFSDIWLNGPATLVFYGSIQLDI